MAMGSVSMMMSSSGGSGSGSGRSELSPEEERIRIRDIALAAEANTKQGDIFYLITQRWWQYWIEYVNQDQPINNNNNNANDGSSFAEIYASTPMFKRPPNIDNSSLLIHDSAAAADHDNDDHSSLTTIEIHDTLLEGRDYVLLPQQVWNQLYLWYGGGPPLARKVITAGLSQTELAVEVYPLRLQLLQLPKGDRSTVTISKKETIGELHRRACHIFDLNLQQVCIWDYYGHRKHALMNDMDKTLDDANIQMDQDILVEIINHGNNNALDGCASYVQDNGTTDKEATSISLDPSKSNLIIAGGMSNKGASKTEVVQSQNPTSSIRELDNTYGQTGVCTRGSSCGLTGLLNLGNTCFMNSAIQCLVHTPEFARYFREDYHQEINWQNPLGMVGELAMAFGDLLRKLWAPGRTSVAPRPFKAKLARFAPQFSGYNQHDSQELLAFLLDGLHEDLNRVKHKPYIKSRDADGRPDEEVADEYWANHIARNDSIIVDVCQGQYKSTLVCPVCNKVSVTFDPFMYLSLPLQSTTTRTMTVTVFTSDGSKLPSTLTVTVPKQGRCRDLIQALNGTCSLKHNEKLLLAEVRDHFIHKFLEDPLISLSTIKDDDHIAAYKIPKLTKNTKYIQLVHRSHEQVTSDAHKMSGWRPFGTPLVSVVSSDGPMKKVYLHRIVKRVLSPIAKIGTSMDTDVSDSSMSHAGEDLHQRDSSAETCTSSMNSNDPKSKVVEPFKLTLPSLNEDNVCIDLSSGEEAVVQLSSSSSSVLVYVDWSQRHLKKFDTCYLESLPEVFKSGPVMKKARTEPLSLYSCLESFLREEPLVPEDMWFCPQCKERRQASKKLDLWRLPEVLVIHLKRFSYSRSMKHKLETFVNFPIHDFDLTNYVANKNNSQRQLYELYALTNHYGGMGSGHYTAHIKLIDENRWHNFDDSHVSPINEEEVKSAAAYVLFYRRVKTEDVSVSNGVQSCASTQK